MTYGNLNAVKERLQILSTITVNDTEIQNILSDVDALINLRLRKETALPLPSTSPWVVELGLIANDWAAGIFRYRRSPPSETINAAFLNQMNMMLEQFIVAHFRQTIFKPISGNDLYSEERPYDNYYFRRRPSLKQRVQGFLHRSSPWSGWTGTWPMRFRGGYALTDYHQGTFLIRLTTPVQVMPNQTARFYAIFVHAEDGLFDPASLALTLTPIEGGAAVTPTNTLVYETMGKGMWYVDVEMPSSAANDKYTAVWTGTYAPNAGNVQGGNPGGPYNVRAQSEFKVVGTVW